MSPGIWLLLWSITGKAMAPQSGTLAGKSHGWRSLVGCSPWGHQESDTTEWLPFHFSLSCIGEGNGNPLQCSCLENPRDGEPGGLPSLGSHRVGHDWSDLAALSINHCVAYYLAPSFYVLGFPGGLKGKASSCNVGDPCSIPGSGKSPGKGNGNPLWYSCLENPMDGEAW